MKVLIFGAGGEVGRFVARAFPGHEVRGLRHAEADIRDRAAVCRAVEDFRPDAVILAAAMANADICEDHPEDAYAVNVDGTRNVAEASRDCHLTFFSSDHVFDGKNGPYSEDDSPKPLSVYGRTKAEAERIALTAHPRCLLVRTTLVFHGEPWTRSFFLQLRNATEPVACWMDHFATYIHAVTLAEAVAELVDAGRTGIWNIGGTDVINRHEFALKVAARFGLDPGLFQPVSIRQAPPRAPRPLRAGLKVDKARAALRTRMLPAEEAIDLAYRHEQA